MNGPILVLDIGTSSAKAVLFDRAGHVLGQSARPYPTATPAPGRQEQDPGDWWRAAVSAVRDITPPGDVVAIALTGTMQNVIPLAKSGDPVRPAILYGDSRATEVFERLRPDLDRLNAGVILGNEPDALLSIFKLLWLREHEPANFAATHTLLTGAKDYIAHRLTGYFGTDPTQATTTGMMDLATRDWSAPILALACIDRAMLPAIAPADTIVGGLTESAAAAIGMPAGIPVVNGSGDAGASTIGAGISAPGEVYIYLGTSGWVARVAAMEPGRVPLSVYTVAHPLDENVIEVAAILSAAGAVSWLQGVLGLDDLSTLEAAADAHDGAPTSLLFLPYLLGERNPFHDAKVRGAFLGLDNGTGRGALFYAVMEGVAFAVRHNFEALGAAPPQIRLLGGAGQNRLWPQLIADILNMPVLVAAAPAAATALGAHRIAARAFGHAVAGPVSGATCMPRSDRRQRADRLYRRFLDATAFARHLAD